MVDVCVVPGCLNRSDREKNLSYFGLPLKNKKLLKQWIHKIGRSNLPLTTSSRVCSAHFVRANGRLLHVNEYPTIGVPVLPTPCRTRKGPTKRYTLSSGTSSLGCNSNDNNKTRIAWPVLKM